MLSMEKEHPIWRVGEVVMSPLKEGIQFWRASQRRKQG